MRKVCPRSNHCGKFIINIHQYLEILIQSWMKKHSGSDWFVSVDRQHQIVIGTKISKWSHIEALYTVLHRKKKYSSPDATHSRYANAKQFQNNRFRSFSINIDIIYQRWKSWDKTMLGPYRPIYLTSNFEANILLRRCCSIRSRHNSTEYFSFIHSSRLTEFWIIEMRFYIFRCWCSNNNNNNAWIYKQIQNLFEILLFILNLFNLFSNHENKLRALLKWLLLLCSLRFILMHVLYSYICIHMYDI